MPRSRHGVGRGVARFDLDRLSRLQAVAFDEAQERRILIGDARHASAARRSGTSAGCRGAAATIVPFGGRNGIAVRIVRRPSEHLVDALDQPLRHDVFELLGLVVHLGPAHAHHLHEKQLDEPVTPQHQAGQLLAGRRQPHAAVRLVLGEARLRQRLHHRRRGAGRDAERRRHLSHRHEPRVGRQRRLALVDGLEVVLDGARRQHARGYYPLRLRRCPSRTGSPRPKASAATSARCLPTIADRYDLDHRRPFVRPRSPVEAASGRARGAGAGSRRPRSRDRHRRHRLRSAARGAARGRPRRHAPDDRAGDGESACGPAARLRFLVGDMLALPFRAGVVRRRDDRLRPAERAGSDARDRRDRARAQAGRPGAVARFQPACQRAGPRASTCAYLTHRGRRSLGWLLHRDPDTYRYIPASIRQLSWRGRRGAADGGARLPGACATTRCSAG